MKGTNTNKEFCLSDKIKKTDWTEGSMIFVTDVKEFIKRLKDKLNNKVLVGDRQIDLKDEIIEDLDKLVGEKLI